MVCVRANRCTLRLRRRPLHVLGRPLHRGVYGGYGCRVRAHSENRGGGTFREPQATIFRRPARSSSDLEESISRAALSLRGTRSSMASAEPRTPSCIGPHDRRAHTGKRSARARRNRESGQPGHDLSVAGRSAASRAEERLPLQGLPRAAADSTRREREASIADGRDLWPLDPPAAADPEASRCLADSHRARWLPLPGHLPGPAPFGADSSSSRDDQRVR
jgi:hypothetical protein